MQYQLQKEILLATNNSGKVKELQFLLTDLAGVKLITPKDLELFLDVAETGSSYAENAALKARAFSEASGLLSLADDSGLEIDALDGAPGLYSKRYGAVKGAAQHEYVLDKLSRFPEEARTARFRAVVAICSPGGDVQLFEGTCEGRIGFQAVGTHGFGYDPLFYLPEYGCTMAELDEGIKNQISHRARAIQKALPALKQHIENDTIN